MTIYCGESTGSIIWVPPSCPPGSCQPGIGFDELCCRCHDRPPPPSPVCGPPCADTATFYDPFDGTEFEENWQGNQDPDAGIPWWFVEGGQAKLAGHQFGGSIAPPLLRTGVDNPNYTAYSWSLAATVTQYDVSNLPQPYLSFATLSSVYQGQENWSIGWRPSGPNGYPQMRYGVQGGSTFTIDLDPVTYGDFANVPITLKLSRWHPDGRVCLGLESRSDAAEVGIGPGQTSPACDGMAINGVFDNLYPPFQRFSVDDACWHAEDCTCPDWPPSFALGCHLTGGLDGFDILNPAHGSGGGLYCAFWDGAVFGEGIVCTDQAVDVQVWSNQAPLDLRISAQGQGWSVTNERMTIISCDPFQAALRIDAGLCGEVLIVVDEYQTTRAAPLSERAIRWIDQVRRSGRSSQN